MDETKSRHYYYNWNHSEISYNDHGAWPTTFAVKCDIASFSVLQDQWGKDAHYIYYQGKAKPNVDIATFYLDADSVPKDKNFVFSRYWSSDNDSLLTWEGADPKTFRLLNIYLINNNEIWGKDDNNYFRVLKPMLCDYQSFEVISTSYSKDKDHVYYKEFKVAGADPQSFRYDSTSQTYRDNKQVYFEGKVK